MASSATVQRVVQRIIEHRQRLERFCRALSEEELSRPVPDSTWTVKDFIVHLGTLDTEMARWLRGVSEGRMDEPARGPEGAPFDVDRWNEERVAERRGWPLARVLEEAAANRKELIALLEGLTDEVLERTVRFPGDNKREPAEVQLGLFLRGWARHDPIHVADMLKALPERATDPELAAWLDDRVVAWYQQVMSGPPRR